MPPGKRLGYNWKARQSKGGASTKRKRETVKCVDLVGAQDDQRTQYGGVTEWDTNVHVLPEKKAKTDLSEARSVHNKKKMSSKQRRRLQKIVEAKERKAKVRAPLVALFRVHRYTWSCSASFCHSVSLPCARL